MEGSQRRPPLARALPADGSVHRQPQRLSKRKPAKYHKDDSFTTGESPFLYQLLHACHQGCRQSKGV